MTLQKVNVFVAQLDFLPKDVRLLAKFALKESVFADQFQVAKGMLSTHIVTRKIASVYQVCMHIKYYHFHSVTSIMIY